jgi:hypothetical protein
MRACEFLVVVAGVRVCLAQRRLDALLVVT